MLVDFLQLIFAACLLVIDMAAEMQLKHVWQWHVGCNDCSCVGNKLGNYCCRLEQHVMCYQ